MNKLSSGNCTPSHGRKQAPSSWESSVHTCEFQESADEGKHMCITRHLYADGCGVVHISPQSVKSI